MIKLRCITEENFEECFQLRASVENENFVDTVTYSLAEAWVFYKDTKPFAIYNDETMVGFVSMYVGEKHYQIINFLIDDKYQGKGYGTNAAKLCVDLLKNEYGAKTISVPVDTRHAQAQRFWSKLGFIASNNIENGYIFMRYKGEY